MSITDGASDRTIPSRLTTYEHGAGFLLARLGATVERQWREVLRSVGLTQSEFAIVTACPVDEPIRQSELAKRAGLDARNAVPVVAALVRRGLLSSEPDPRDGRARLIRATPLARELSAQLEALLTFPRERFFEPLSTQEYDTLCELLERLYWHTING